MTTLALVEARKSLGKVVDRVRYQGEQVVLTANGEPAAVMVSIERLRLLEHIENLRDARAMRRALKEQAASGIPAKTLAQFKAERGL